MIKETNQRIVKVHFKDDGFWDSNGCDCCESIYSEAWNFSRIEGVENPEQYQSYDYEMYNGSKVDVLDCLLTVLWDLVADQSKCEGFYDMCKSLYDVYEYDIVTMLSDKGIEVVFISEED